MYTVVALMLANFLTAVDVTIVDTAMPRIVGALGGFQLLTWVVTAYMLTSTASIPVYGKLADLFGRKKTFIFGAVIFVVGSALCGLSQTMGQLIFFRALQGLGAGAVMPVVQTIIGDLFTPAERAKVQGWFSGVWGFSALVGPLLGGVIVDYASWNWLFYINLPLGVLAVYMVGKYLQEDLKPRKVHIDYLGSVTLTLGITALLLLLLNGGTEELPWASPGAVGLAGATLVLFAVFFWQERRAPDPMLPLALFRNPVIGLSVLASFMVGGVMYGVTVYLPLWAQGVQGYSATRSGASLLWLSIGWPFASLICGRYIVRLGVRRAAILGLGLNLAASGGLVLAARSLEQLPELLMAVLTFVIGCGMGFSTLAFVLGVQSSVGWEQRGVATASLTFLRTLGGLVWVSAMGAVMNLGLHKGLQGIPGLVVATVREAGEIANNLVDPESWSKLPAGQIDLLREALAGALRNVHLLMLAAAAGSLLFALLLPAMRLGEEQTTKAR